MCYRKIYKSIPPPQPCFVCLFVYLLLFLLLLFVLLFIYLFCCFVVVYLLLFVLLLFVICCLFIYLLLLFCLFVCLFVCCYLLFVLLFVACTTCTCIPPERSSLSINALHACVYIYIWQLISLRAPTLWFIHLTVTTCHNTSLSSCQKIFTRKQTKHKNP